VKQLASALLYLVSVTACAGPQHLFNGLDLSGWESRGEIDWRVEDGVIVASGSGKGFIATRAEFGDFYLRVEFWVDATTNSGLFVRCRDRTRIYPDTCYELNIYDQHPNQEARTGAVVFVHMPPDAHVETADKWNVYEVTARGKFIEVKVNGTVTAVLEDADPTPGFIALQHWESGTVKFRSIELSPY
jgi:hypothetical protein